MPKSMLAIACAPLVLATACASNDPATTSATAAITDGDDDAPDDEDGSSSNSGSATSTTPTSTTSSTTTSSPSSTTVTASDSEPTSRTETGEPPSTTGEPSCLASSECDATEVCSADGTCVDALSCDYEILIVTLTGVSCDDGVGEAEVLWRMFRGEMLAFESQIDTCPLAWGDIAEYVPTDQQTVFYFYEIDAVADDELFYFCFDASCGGIPVGYLHDGGWEGTVDNDLYYLNIEIRPTC